MSLDVRYPEEYKEREPVREKASRPKLLETCQSCDMSTAKRDVKDFNRLQQPKLGLVEQLWLPLHRLLG